MNTRHNLLFVVSIASFWATACSAVDKAAGPALLQASSYEICPWKLGESGFDVVRDSLAWQQLLSQSQKRLGELTKWTPDFKNGQRVVLYRLGQKSSAGFSASFGAPSLLPNNQLRLPVTLNQPAAGTLNAMLLTSPCVISLVQISSATTVDLINDSNKAVIATGRL